MHICKCARTYLYLFILQVSFLELNKNKVVPLTNNISKGHLFAVLRLALRLPPYLLFADLLDSGPDLQSITHVVHFINSYLVSTSNFFQALLHMYHTRHVPGES